MAILSLRGFQTLACVSFSCLENQLLGQHAKKVKSDSPGLVDFAIGLAFFVLNLPDGQVLFFGEIQITEGLLSILPSKRVFGLAEMTCGLVHAI